MVPKLPPLLLLRCAAGAWRVLSMGRSRRYEDHAPLPCVIGWRPYRYTGSGALVLCCIRLTSCCPFPAGPSCPSSTWRTQQALLLLLRNSRAASHSGTRPATALGA